MYSQLACQIRVIKCTDFILGKLLFPYGLPFDKCNLTHIILTRVTVIFLIIHCMPGFFFNFCMSLIIKYNTGKNMIKEE